MKHQQRWIPAAWHRFTQTEGTDAVLYLYEFVSRTTRKTGYAVVAYHGEALGKPDGHVTFRTAKERAEYIRHFIDGRKSHADLKRDRRARRAAPHTLQIGDVLKNRWGYDQTVIDYFEVTAVLGPHVEIRPIDQAVTETGWAQGTCSPLPGQFTGPALVKRADKDNSVKIHDWGSWAYKVSKDDVGNWWTSIRISHRP
jgi:hypothetical protein